MHLSPAPSRQLAVLVGAEFEENLSIRYLAAAIRQDGWEVELLPFDEPDQMAGVVERICELRPLVLGISVPFQLRARELLSVATGSRSRGYDGHITAGGHFVTFEYANVLRDYPALDSIVRHEGEATFREICEAVVAGTEIAGIPGTVTRCEGRFTNGGKRALPPLDELPFPDRRGAPHQVMGVNCSPIVGSRGCYADCSFCCIYAYADNADGARYRRRSPKSIVDEMKQEYEQRKVRLFIFHDDNFFVPSERQNIARYEEMYDRLTAAGMHDIGLVIKCRPNDVHPQLFELLKSMGLIRAYVGIETNSDEGVVSLNRRITPDDNRRALRILRELDVYHSYNVLIFDPEATLDGVRRNLDFMREFAHVPFNFCRAEVYAGTPLKTILEHQGRLQGDYAAWGYEMRDPSVEVLFRISATAFATRNFKHDGVANLNLGIRFDNEVMRHFFPECWDESWHHELENFSARVGHSSVDLMTEAVEFVQQHSPHDKVRVKAFARDVAHRVARADLTFLRECKRFRREMERRIVQSGNGAVTSFARRRPPWAAETLRLGNSIGRDVSTETLPAPQFVAGG